MITYHNSIRILRNYKYTFISQKNTDITHTHTCSVFSLLLANKNVEISTTFKVLYHVHPDKFRGMCVEKVLLGSHKCQKQRW